MSTATLVIIISISYFMGITVGYIITKKEINNG